MKTKTLLFYVLFFLFGKINAQVVYVTQNGAGLKDGTSWSNAIDSLQLRSHLSAAVGGTEFWIAAGTYKPNYNIVQTYTFEINDNVKVYGGFSGTETDLGQRDFVNNVTILDGSIGNSSDTDNVNRIVTFNHVSDQTLLDGFTLQNAYNNNPSGFPAARGGAIYNDGTLAGSSNPVIANCIIQNNQSTSGAGCYSNASDGGEVGEHFINCLFRNNICFFSHGAAYRSARLNGGNIYTVFENCEFENNIASKDLYFLYGGAIYIGTTGSGIGETDARILNCKFTGNFAFLGGAIFLQNNSDTKDSVVISNCEFYNNISTAGGSAIYGTYDGPGIGSVAILSSIIKGNSEDSVAGYVKGAINLNGNLGVSNYLIDNCLITGNNSSVGGAISLNAATPLFHTTISNSTIAGNDASILGGGISITIYNPGDVVDLHIHNSILWGNSSLIEEDTASYNGTPTIEVDNSIITGGYAGTNNLDSDPLFINEIPFANAPDTSGDYQLQANSPAINSGDNNFVVSTDDILGNFRIHASVVDMGCYEYGSVYDGIIQLKNESNSIVVFPNPTSDYIEIQNSDENISSIEIMDLTGKIVLEEKVFIGERINISKLDQGMYLLNVFDEHKKQLGIEKIIKL